MPQQRSTLPPACKVGEALVSTQETWECSATNTWTLMRLDTQPHQLQNTILENQGFQIMLMVAAVALAACVVRGIRAWRDPHDCPLCYPPANGKEKTN